MSWRRRRLWTVLAACAIVAATAAGCASTSADQCTAGASGDSDCEPILGVAVGAALCDNGTCRLKGQLPPSASDASPAIGQGDGGHDEGGPPPCTTTEQCTKDANGKASICREPGVSPCLQIENDLCRVHGDGWKDGTNPIFIGVLLSETGPEGEVSYYSTTNRQIIQLSEAEWRTATSGGLNVGGERRPLVNVYCDLAVSAERTRAAFDHVTGTLGAPAVITETMFDVAAFVDQAKERGTFLYLTEFGCEELAITDKVNGHCFTNSPPYAYSLPLFKERVRILEAEARAERHLQATDKIKVALLADRQDGVSAADFIERVMKELEFNGAGNTAAMQPAQYKEIAPAFFPDETPDYFTTATAISSFAPDIVLTLEARNFHFFYLPLIEASWPAVGYRPRYVTNESGGVTRRYEVSVGGNDELRARVGGIYYPSLPSTADVFDDLTTRFAAANAGQDTGGISTGLDSYYATAFGIAAALSSATVAGAKLTGTDIGQAMKRLVGGEPTPIRPSTINDGLLRLKQLQSLDLTGSVGLMDWNPVTGATESDAALYCVKRDPDTRALFVDDLGFYYRQKTTSFDPLPFVGECP